MIKAKKGWYNMTFLKYILSVLMIATAISSAILIFSEEKEELPNVNQYVLRYENGMVSLFENGELSETFEDINFDVLPFADKENLKTGIEKSSYDEILSLVEDFDG